MWRRRSSRGISGTWRSRQVRIAPESFGPTIASAILSVATWHWLFLVNVPAGLVAVLLSLQNLPATPRAAHEFDVVAALLCAGLFAFLILAISCAA